MNKTNEKVCNRCSTPFSPNDAVWYGVYDYLIFYHKNYDYDGEIFSEEVDLCPDCIEAFREFLNEREEQLDEENSRIEHCYECTGYGDDYRVDASGDLVCNCLDCPYNGDDIDD